MENIFLESLVSDQTRKSYKRGLAKFSEFYPKGPKGLLGEEDPAKIIERYYVWLKKKYKQNTCRSLTNPIIQYVKYNNIPLNIRRSLGVFRTTLTTRDHILTSDEARAMYDVSSLEEKVLVKTWLLGLRIGDACRLEWKQFNFESTDDLKETLVYTKKEGIVAHCYIDPEFQELLVKHILTLDQKNPYLFQSERKGHLSEKQMLRKIQSLQRRAQIKAHGSFNWHIARKLFLRVCAENGVTSWNAKLMCGKQVDKSIKTYINHVNLKKDAIKVSRVLRMDPVKNNGRVGNLEETVQLVTKAFGQFLRKMLKEEGYGTEIGFTVDYDKMSDEELIKWYLGER
ncbi:MAG: tyrosine-type recombinase/integrase [Candidatus Bathyarchaeota archaeon]|nr:tyrosine-type recombinase/integrase [Candidatus Bathyarchaeota archaeon]